MIKTIVGNYNLEVEDSWRLLNLQEIYLLCDTSTSSPIINLFEIADLEEFWNVKIFITDISNNASVNNIIVNAFGSDTIDSSGTNSISLQTDGSALQLQVVSGTQWMASESIGGGVVPTSIIQLGTGAGSSVRIGNGNTASGDYSTALALNNSASGYASSVLGGQNNTASGYLSTVSNGYGNTASGSDTTVSNGFCNTASGNRSAVSNGAFNIASNCFSTVINGNFNTASGYRSTVSNGYGNTTSCNLSTVLNGCCNTASGFQSTVSNGQSNTASGCRSFIASGQFNNTCSLADTFIVGSCILADRVCATFVNNLSIKNIPTSSAGLPAGSVWSDTGTLKIV